MNISTKEANFLEQIPDNSGVYRYYDHGHNLLYVGKAINLHKRVASYFKARPDSSPRINLMIKQIFSIEITITTDEAGALILENNLIKSLRPKYNIIFRDDKSYPLICLSDHPYPFIETNRHQETPGTYFGPYPNAKGVKRTLDIVNKVFLLRTCSDSFFNSRIKPCMLYQIERCSAPCVGLITQIEYKQQVKNAADFLNGKYPRLINNLTEQMNQAAAKYEFEIAGALRDKISQIKQISQHQIINDYNKPISLDIVLCKEHYDRIYIYIIILHNGIYVGDKNFILPIIDNEPLTSYERFFQGYYVEHPTSQNVYTNAPISLHFKELLKIATKVEITNKLAKSLQLNKLYAMAELNLEHLIKQSQTNFDLQAGAKELAIKLNLVQINKIECIDISHNHGEHSVASLVCYCDGIIDHKRYRRYNLDNTINGNDLKAIEVTLTRRLEQQLVDYPDVLLIDGGALQFNLVKNVVAKYQLHDKIRVISIYKGEKRNPMLDTAILDTEDLLYVKDNPLVFKLLHALRDEAHRFAITAHRKKQIKKMHKSKLDDIAGVGVNIKKALMLKFGSVTAITKASLQDLQATSYVGEALAKRIYNYFHE